MVDFVKKLNGRDVYNIREYESSALVHQQGDVWQRSSRSPWYVKRCCRGL